MNNKKKRDEQKYTDSIWPKYEGKNKQHEGIPLWSQVYLELQPIKRKNKFNFNKFTRK